VKNVEKMTRSHLADQRRRGAESWNTQSGSCKFPTEHLMGSKNFNFAPK